MVENTD